MAIGYQSAGICHSTVQAAAFTAIDAMYPRPVTTTGITSANGGFEVLTAITANGSGLVTYSTRNNFTNVGIATNRQFQLQQCDTDWYLSAAPAYNYSEAAAAYGFVMVTVLMHWLVAKHGGMIVNAVKRL